MKIGIITDIHSNVQALNKILKEFEKLKVDNIICCGDIIGIGINPEETVQELLKRKEILIAVRGNHEQYLLNGLPNEVHNNKRNMCDEEIANHKWNQSKLSKQSIEFLRNMKLFENIEIEGKKIYICHYPQNRNGTYKKHIKNSNINELKELFRGKQDDIFIFGHTHTYSIINEENKWYINTGSLGCPMNSNIAKAGLLEINNEKITFSSINIQYNVKEIIKEFNKLKFPFYKKILHIFYGM